MSSLFLKYDEIYHASTNPAYDMMYGKICLTPINIDSTLSTILVRLRDEPNPH